ncbi:hypothetical protein FB645_001375 [Coemansia sp. IMI 203386]|nr:hypothetical protein FB645_001375 [Coemansia sp. IMI 203386]
MTTLRSNSQRTRLRAEPVTGVCGFVASGNAPVRLPTVPMTLKRQSNSYLSLNTAKETSKPAAITEIQHQRVLELLRVALASAAKISLPGSDSKHASESNKNTILAAASAAAAGISLKEEHRARAVATLEQKRQALVGMLREMQSPNAENIVTTHSLLCNRSKLGLLDMASARDYGLTMHNADNGHASAPISINEEEHPADATLASSLASDSSEETLTEAGAEADADVDAEYDVLEIRTTADRSSSAGTLPATAPTGLKASLVEIWASNGFWRGVSARSWSSRASRRESVCSINTLVGTNGPRSAAAYETPALPDAGGVCWALTDALHELATQSWNRFYASLGGVRVPTRYRTPRHSLNMLATEQLMMRNDKLICPLKNRLQEPNPRRQVFEEYIRATGTVPPPDSVSDRKIRSPLCNEL